MHTLLQDFGELCEHELTRFYEHTAWTLPGAVVLEWTWDEIGHHQERSWGLKASSWASVTFGSQLARHGQPPLRTSVALAARPGRQVLAPSLGETGRGTHWAAPHGGIARAALYFPLETGAGGVSGRLHPGRLGCLLYYIFLPLLTRLSPIWGYGQKPYIKGRPVQHYDEPI